MTLWKRILVGKFFSHKLTWGQRKKRGFLEPPLFHESKTTLWTADYSKICLDKTKLLLNGLEDFTLLHLP
jgi:hypothetical protein